MVAVQQRERVDDVVVALASIDLRAKVLPHLLGLAARAAVQRLVNAKIREDIEVHPHEESYEDALAGGAMALFGEKYSEKVRVVDICEPPRPQTSDNHACFSRELCGGTHCHRTGEIGAFVIESEGSVGSGLRRIAWITWLI